MEVEKPGKLCVYTLSLIFWGVLFIRTGAVVSRRMPPIHSAF